MYLARFPLLQTLKIAALVLTIAVLRAPSAWAELFSETIQEDLKLKDTKRLAFIVPKGEFRVLGWSQERLRITLKKKTHADTAEIAKQRFTEVNLSRLDTYDSVELRIAHKRGANLLERLKARSEAQVDVDWEIRAPWGMKLDLSQGQGDIAIDQWFGGLTLRSGGGLVRLTNLNLKENLVLSAPKSTIEIIDGEFSGSVIAGQFPVLLQKIKIQKELFIETEKSEIRGEKISGTVRVQSDSGNIVMKDFLGHLDVRTKSGSVEVQKMNGPCEIHGGDGVVAVQWDRISKSSWVESATGAVTLTLPQNFDGKLDLLSLVGSTLVQFPLEQDKNDSEKYGPIAPGKVYGKVGTSEIELKVVAKAPIRVQRQGGKP